MTEFCFLLALVWGGSVALFLQFHRLGKFLALHRTWITVVIGIGGDMLILLLLLPVDTWFTVALVVTLSSFGVIIRSLYRECSETEELIDHERDRRDGTRTQ